MRHTVLILLCTLGLSACGDSEKAPESKKPNLMQRTATGTFGDAVDTLQSPLVDTGLKREAIPELLKPLAKYPYTIPEKPYCQSISKELTELNALLGRDVDTTTTAEEASYAEQGADIARSSAVGLLRGQVDILPYRGIVRKVSGAEKHEKRVRAAYAAGRVRRGFLKGIAVTYGCPDALSNPAAK